MRAFDEAKLIKLMHSNPERGLRYAMEVFGGAIETIVGNILRNCSREDVEECISECFFRFWKDFGTWDRGKGALKSWFYSIARHTAIDFRRKIGRNYVLSLDDDLEIADGNLEEEIIKRLTAREIQIAVSEMAEPDRSVFILRFFWYFSYEEIACKTGLTQIKVKNILYRSKKALRERLMDKGVKE